MFLAPNGTHESTTDAFFVFVNFIAVQKETTRAFDIISIHFQEGPPTLYFLMPDKSRQVSHGRGWHDDLNIWCQVNMPNADHSHLDNLCILMCLLLRDFPRCNPSDTVRGSISIK